MSNLEKLFCRCRALGLTDEDEQCECLSAAVVELRRGSEQAAMFELEGRIFWRRLDRLKGGGKETNHAGWMDG